MPEIKDVKKSATNAKTSRNVSTNVTYIENNRKRNLRDFIKDLKDGNVAKLQPAKKFG